MSRALYEDELDFFVADFLEDYDTEFAEEAKTTRVYPVSPTAISTSCIVFWRTHETGLTEDHHQHLDAITNQIALRSHGGHPIAWAKIIGHA